jgi:triphosphoribosyl-dephospho-CoA synthase
MCFVPRLQTDDVAVAAQLACLLEVSAPKPGNVSPGRDFADARYEDFLASAAALGPSLALAGTRPLGATVRHAVEATARWTRSNTNLGIVLLLAPLAHAALRADADDRDSDLRDAVQAVLGATTVDDAREVYAAIRRAAPGGLGRAETQDVADEPTITLREAMALAAGRDWIAREYATGFQITFEQGAPALESARRDGLSWDDAIVETFLTLLAAHPDTHIARRGGIAMAERVTQRARAVLDAGGVRSIAGHEGHHRDGSGTARRGKHRKSWYHRRPHRRRDLRGAPSRWVARSGVRSLTYHC